MNAIAPAAPRILTLDGLRGSAVLMILAHHYAALGPLLDAPVETARSYLRAALVTPTSTEIDLFFVLSEFLVDDILLDYRTSPGLLPTFYLRRFVRIVPLAWLFITIAFGLSQIADLPDLAGPAGCWPYYTFTTNFALAAHKSWWLSWLTPLWSVAIEEQFYLLLPLVVRFWPASRLEWIGPALILTAWVSRAVVLLAAPDHPFICHMLMPCRLDAFGCGFTAAWLVRSNLWPVWQALGNRRWVVLLLPAAACAALFAQRQHAWAMATWGYTAIAAFDGVLLLLIYDPASGWLRNLFSSSLLRTYGKYSYFIYLFQTMLVAPVLGLIFHGSWKAPVPANVLECLVAFVLPLPVAWASWRYFEEPFLSFGRRRSYT